MDRLYEGYQDIDLIVSRWSCLSGNCCTVARQEASRLAREAGRNDMNDTNEMKEGNK